LEVKDYFIFLVFGKVAIFFLQTFPPLRRIKWKFLQEALDCDLCTGTWAMIFLSFVFGINLLPKANKKQNVISTILTGATSSLLVHLVSLGFKEKWSVINFNVKEE
jgi:hypothetical protein